MWATPKRGFITGLKIKKLSKPDNQYEFTLSSEFNELYGQYHAQIILVASRKRSSEHRFCPHQLPQLSTVGVDNHIGNLLKIPVKQVMAANPYCS